MTSEHENRQPLGDDADFAAHTAAPLRAAETLDATFESRLATAIRRDLQLRGGGASSSQGWRQWWLRQRTVSISPLVGFAIAAGLAAIIVAGALSASLVLTRPLTGDMHMVGGDVQLVRFVFLDSTARSVTLVGDFNAWNRTANDLEPTGTRGAWSITIPLRTGRHEYAFIVDSTRWVADPFASGLHDDFGTESSVITLGRDTSLTPTRS